MTNYQSGHDAEKVAADYLQRLGYEVLELNWKTRYCEIDIVAKKGKMIYFVEVKSRRDNSQGYGYEYVTPKKLRQMGFAAELWVSSHDFHGDYQLAVISIDAGTITFFDEL